MFEHLTKSDSHWKLIWNFFQLQQTEPEQTPMAQDQTDLFSQGSKQLPSGERKVHSLELSNLTAYVSVPSNWLRIFTFIRRNWFFFSFSFSIAWIQRKPASNDSPSSLGESCSNNRSSSSVKILSNISLPPYRPSMSSQNSSHNTHLTSQGGKLQGGAFHDSLRCRCGRHYSKSNHFVPIWIWHFDRSVSLNWFSDKTHSSVFNQSQQFIKIKIDWFYQHWLIERAQSEFQI